MKRILVPVSCDEPSERALKLATSISKKNNSRVYVLRVIQTHGGATFDHEGDPIGDMGTDLGAYAEQKRLQSENLDKWTKAINPEAYQVVKYGGVADVILETMSKYKVGLVILGNRYGEEEKFQFFGDLTSYLINKSPVPILSLKTEMTGDNLKQIVFANEFDHKLSYYDALQDLHLFFDTKVDFLNIVNKKSLPREEIEENMEYFARINMIKYYEKHFHEADNVEEGIIEWISKNPCDLLAVKNIRKAGGSPLFKSKLSKKFLRNTNASTLVYND